MYNSYEAKNRKVKIFIHIVKNGFEIEYKITIS